MKNNVKVLIAVLCFAIAGTVVAYNLGLFESSGKKPASSGGTAATGAEGAAPGAEAPKGSVGVGSDVFSKPTG